MKFKIKNVPKKSSKASVISQFRIDRKTKDILDEMSKQSETSVTEIARQMIRYCLGIKTPWE